MTLSILIDSSLIPLRVFYVCLSLLVRIVISPSVRPMLSSFPTSVLHRERDDAMYKSQVIYYYLSDFSLHSVGPL